MRLYLDTNILFFMFQHQEDEMDGATKNLIFDCANQLHASIVCVGELIQLVQTRSKKAKHKGMGYESVLDWMNDAGIKIEPITNSHITLFERLPLFDNHHDTLDRLIIAQAIADKATLVSSDTKFPLYRSCGLSLHYNRR